MIQGLFSLNAIQSIKGSEHMNNYVLTAEKFFSGKRTFTVEADTREEAAMVLRKELERDKDYKLDTIKVVKKLKK